MNFEGLLLQPMFYGTSLHDSSHILVPRNSQQISGQSIYPSFQKRRRYEILALAFSSMELLHTLEP